MSRPSRLLTAYFVTAQVTLSYVGAGAVAPLSQRRVLSARHARQASAERAPHRGGDRPAARPVHQGRPAHQHHGQLPARRLSRGAARAAGSGPAAALRRHRGAPARGVRRPRAHRGLRRVLDHAGRVGVDRPGPHRAPADRRARRGQGAVPRHRGDRPHRPARAEAHLRPAALVHARLRLRHDLPRDPRDGVGRARLPAGGVGDAEDRRQLRRAARTCASRA